MGRLLCQTNTRRAGPRGLIKFSVNSNVQLPRRDVDLTKAGDREEQK